MNQRSLHRNAILSVILVLTLFGLIPFNVNAQTDNILMNNTTVRSSMLSNGTTIIEYSSTVVNRGTTDINRLELRFDVRTLVIYHGASSSEVSSISATPIDTYNVLLVQLAAPLLSGATTNVFLKFKTTDLQEQYGICPDTGLCLHNMIFYLRPTYEHRNFTYIAKIPTHAVLADDTSPLFPEADGNFTDGNTLGFSWFIEKILPGQERVFIVKYGHLVTAQAPVEIPTDMTLLLIIALFSGALIAVVIERTPKLLAQLRKQEKSLIVGVTSHENDVLRLLKRKGGSCPQRLIYEELDMSQSLASMILTGLEERGLIKRLRDGRENMVHIIED